MAYVIASTCIDVKDGACQETCPVECIYEGGRMMYIQPDERIDCGLCLSICPVDAIYVNEDLPKASVHSSAPTPSSFDQRSPVGARPAAPTRRMSARSTIRWSRYAPFDVEAAAEIG